MCLSTWKPPECPPLWFAGYSASIAPGWKSAWRAETALIVSRLIVTAKVTDVPALNHALGGTSPGNLDHRAAHAFRRSDVVRQEQLPDGIEWRDHGVERPVPSRLGPNSVEWLDVGDGIRSRAFSVWPFTRAHIMRPRSVLSVPAPET